ncbi:MAG TPA: hypothetical protein VF059_04670 [Casimicrobiaceae bacterium]
MGDPTSDLHPPRRRHDVLEIPIVWVALVLSLLLHVGALWLWLPSLLDRAHDARFGDGSQIVADLRPAAPPSAPPPAPPVIVPPAPPVIAPPVPTPSPTPPPPKRAPAPKAARPKAAPVPSAPPPPPMVAERAPVAIPAPAPSPPEPAAVPNPRSAVTAAPRESDLSAYIEARRRARGEAPSEASAPAPAAAPETDRERLNRMVASNLGLNRTPSFGYDPERAGGMFQITSLEYDYADFWFFGLNKTINRNTKQKIVVRKGDEPDIRIAVVRRMITIIRDHVSGDFTWISRAGAVTMSARPSENAALEAFIMRDIFPDYR